MMDAQIRLSKEEYALSMVQIKNTSNVKNDAAVKDAQIKLRREECAKSMGQRLNANDAAVKDAQVMP